MTRGCVRFTLSACKSLGLCERRQIAVNRKSNDLYTAEVCMEETRPTKFSERFSQLYDSAWFGIGVGTMIGALGSSLPSLVLVCFGWVCVCVQAFRFSIFNLRGFRWLLANVGMCLALGGLFGLCWYLVPRPSPPITIGQVKQALQESQPTAKTTIVLPPTSNDNHAATKEDIRKISEHLIELQLQNKVQSGASISPTNPPQQSAPSKAPETSVAPQLQPIKIVALTLADEINKWADQRLKEAPESFPPSQTSEEQKKAAAFHDQIVSEWHDRYGRIAGVTLNQLYLVWRDVLKIPVPSVHACMLDNIGMAQGDRGILETKKRCANFIKEAAERIN